MNDIDNPQALEVVPASEQLTNKGNKVTFTKEGALTWTPVVPNFNGNDSFTYQVTDGSATITVTAQVAVSAWARVPCTRALHDGSSAHAAVRALLALPRRGAAGNCGCVQRAAACQRQQPACQALTRPAPSPAPLRAQCP